MQPNIVRASLKELRMTPRKVGEVVALVRNRSVDDALVILSHTPRRAAKPVAKLIESARANATNNHGLKADGLQIATISVTSGARMKRYRPVARGMAHPFQKRSSNIYLTLSGVVKPSAKRQSEQPTRHSELDSESSNNNIAKGDEKSTGSRVKPGMTAAENSKKEDK
jgi:large subunit ribosomal protein L22